MTVEVFTCAICLGDLSEDDGGVAVLIQEGGGWKELLFAHRRCSDDVIAGHASDN